MPLPQLTALNHYRLKRGAGPFAAGITALAARVEAEGERGLVDYRFYVDATGETAKAVIDYAIPAAWIGHHDIAMDWPEMRALHDVAELVEVTFLGEVTPEITAWIAGSRLRADLHVGYSFVAGFSRD